MSLAGFHYKHRPSSLFKTSTESARERNMIVRVWGLASRPPRQRCARGLDARAPWPRLSPCGQNRDQSHGVLRRAESTDRSGYPNRYNNRRRELSLGIFAALAEFESEPIREKRKRTMAGIQTARARGQKGGRKCALTAQVRMAQTTMTNRDTAVSKPCAEGGIRPVTLYHCVDPNGNLQDHGKRVLGA